jgi:hypothetical protein
VDSAACAPRCYRHIRAGIGGAYGQSADVAVGQGCGGRCGIAAAAAAEAAIGGIGGVSSLQGADLGLDRLNDLLPPDLKFRRDDTWRKAREGERH